MPRSAKIVAWGLAAIAAIIAVIALVLSTFNWNMLRPWINEKASEAAGRQVEIRGDLEVDWFNPDTYSGWRAWVPWPEITAHDLVVGNASWGTHGDAMARISYLQTAVNPIALLDRRIELAKLDVRDADILLERTKEGQVNWQFGQEEEKKEEDSQWAFELEQLSLDDVRAQYIDDAQGIDVNTELASLDNGGEYGLGWTATGKYGDAEFEGKGQSGGILDMRAGDHAFPLQGSVSVGTTTLEVEGSITRPKALASLDVELTLAGDTMSDLYPLLGVALPDTPPYKTQGRLLAELEGESDTWRYEDFTGVVGESDLRGTLIYERREPRPKLSGEVASNQLRLQDLGPLIGAPTSDVKSKEAAKDEAAQPESKALPVSDVNTDIWGTMDADVVFKGRRILREKELPLDNIEAHLVLADKVMTFKPLNFGVAGGTLRNTLVLDGNAKPMKARLETAARGLQLRQLFPGAESMDASFGQLNGDAALSAQGNSVSALLAHSNGEIKALISRGTMSHFLLEAAGLNVANAIMLKVFGDEQVMLNCMATSLVVKNGVVHTEVFRLDTEDTIVDVEGRVNLAKESLDLEIRPANKSVRVFTFRSPLYARGTFKNPDIGVEAGPVAARAGAAVALGIIATPFAALLPLLNVGTEDTVSCSSLLKEAKEDPDAPPPGQTQPGTPTEKPAKEKGGDKSAAEAERENWPSNQPKP